MPVFIKHRANTITDLEGVLPEWGVEIDVRCVSFDAPGCLHLAHDPWVRGEDFTTWIYAFLAKKITGPIILNTKEDGLEQSCINILNEAGIQNFFFLDTTFPSLVQWTTKKRESRFAMRLSAFEPLEGVLLFRDMVQWVWVDCFGGIPLNRDQVLKAKKNFKVCLVSPELQGSEISGVSRFKDIFSLADAVCTKHPQMWQQELG
jgi:hypothetical protein